MATLLSYLPEISAEGLQRVTSLLRTEVERILRNRVLTYTTDILLDIENDLKAEGLSWDDLTSQGQVENVHGIVPSDRPIPSDEKWARGETVGDKSVFRDWRYSHPSGLTMYFSQREAKRPAQE